MTNTLRLLSKWWKTWHSLPVFSWMQAAELYSNGRYEEAIPLYEAGLQKHKTHVARLCARMDLSFCYYRCGKLLESESQLKQVCVYLANSRTAHLRLARLQLWMGRPLDAAWTLRRFLTTNPPDEEVLFVYLLAVFENCGPNNLIKDGSRFLLQLPHEKAQGWQANALRARLAIERGDLEKGLAQLERLVPEAGDNTEFRLFCARTYLKLEKIAEARAHAVIAMQIDPEHPRVLSLMASSYLKAGEFYNPEYAQQLATLACQKCTWLGPEEMQVLAESYYHIDDKMSALIMASKAKDEGEKLYGTYRDSAQLEDFIQSLASGTIA